MPLRILGALLCGLAFAACGFYSAFRMRQRLEGLRALYNAVTALRSQVVLYDRPISSGMQAIAEGNLFLQRAATHGDPSEPESIARAGKDLYLKAGDLVPFLSLLSAIPHEARGETRHFELCERELEKIEAQTREYYEKNGSLHIKLGLLTGAAALILLI